MDELKQTARVEILISPILIRKRAHQIVKHAYHQTAYFFMSGNNHQATPSTLTMLHLPLFTLLKITNGSLCHHSFFLNISSLD